jgi:N-methylhydantoinase B/oxoprolinase/acetone carboxylase alpha subunit
MMAPDTLGPVALAVLKGRLEQIADEMDATLFRRAFNPTIAEAHDACHGIYHAQTGATLIPRHDGRTRQKFPAAPGAAGSIATVLA